MLVTPKGHLPPRLSAVGVGPETAQTGGTAGAEIISGGLQDNGGSILRPSKDAGHMSSNFGGDGGDVLVDPANGCNIVQEYVTLSMRVTNQVRAESHRRCVRRLPQRRAREHPRHRTPGHQCPVHRAVRR